MIFIYNEHSLLSIAYLHGSTQLRRVRKCHIAQLLMREDLFTSKKCARQEKIIGVYWFLCRFITVPNYPKLLKIDTFKSLPFLIILVPQIKLYSIPTPHITHYHQFYRHRTTKDPPLSPNITGLLQDSQRVFQIESNLMSIKILIC